MRIGFLELRLETASLSPTDKVFGRFFKGRPSSIMTQAIAVWCRQSGPLAYALAKLYRRDGVLKVIGRPHALIAYHDANFAARFDATMDILEPIDRPMGRRTDRMEMPTIAGTGDATDAKKGTDRC